MTSSAPGDAVERGNGAVFARLASRPIPRVSRMMAVARDAGLEPLFCGAFRDAALPASDSAGEFPIVRTGRFFPLLNGRRPWLYLRSVVAYNRGLYRLLRERQPAVVHASDIETMPACVLYRRGRAVRLVYNIHDNFAYRYRVPGPVAALMNALEGWFVRRSDATVVPESFRRDALPRWCRDRVTVVRNAPDDAGFSEPDIGGGPLRIFFGGWLDWGRGLRSLLQLAASCADVEVCVAGEGSPDIVAEFANHPRVRYLGQVDHAAVMRETRRCHVVWALYDPARPINRFAASNKIAEALAVGRPPVVNAELRIVEALGRPGCFLLTPYLSGDGDPAAVPALADRLRALRDDPQDYLARCRDARRLFEAHYAGDGIRAASLAALFGRPA